MVALLVILVILTIANISISAGSKSRIGFLSDIQIRLIDEIKALKDEMARMRSGGGNYGDQTSRSSSDAESIRPVVDEVIDFPAYVPPPNPPVYTEPVVDIPEVPEEEVAADEEWMPKAFPEQEPADEPAFVSEVFNYDTAVEEEIPAATTETRYHVGPEEPVESWTEKWSRNNPDLEKFIGENLINKIGIAILVLGIAFFVKYAIDKEWINEIGRVSIGIGCGGILVGLAHYMRISYRSFSSVLAGGGIAVFYFTIAFAFHQYHLIPQVGAFAGMVVITGFAVALSVLYDRLELAVIAAIGGFITPFLVSTGDGNYVVLFSYLIILNIGLLSLAWFKRWTVLNVIALAFTEMIYGGWLVSSLSGNKPISYPKGLFFASAFYAIFLGMNMINQLKTKSVFKAFDFALLLFISFSYYSAGMTLLHEWNNAAYTGIFTLCMGFVNLLLAYIVFRNGNADKRLLFLLIGLTLTFLTLTIPIQLHGHAITMFWLAEFVLLYWLSVYSGIRLFRFSSLLICGLAVISLLMDWSNASMIGHGPLLLIYHNVQGIVTNVIAIAAFAVYFLLLRRDPEADFVVDFKNRHVASISLFVSITLLYLTCFFGINLIFSSGNIAEFSNIYHRILTSAFALVLLYAYTAKAARLRQGFVLLPLAVCFLAYLLSANHIATVRNMTVANSSLFGHMMAHWLSSILLCALVVRSISIFRRNPELLHVNRQQIVAGLCILVIVFISIELSHLYVMAFNNSYPVHELTTQYNKAGLTVLWAICSFALMWLGMRHRNKLMRIISLVIFSIVLLKLFLLDIQGISEGGKILAFILLGVVLLVVSFMYQKLKKIIFDDSSEKAE